MRATSLFCLALLPMGFTRQRRYRLCEWSLTPLFHPRHPFEGWQYASLLHYPSSCLAQPLAGIVLCGVRTFLRASFHALRSPDQLDDSIVTIASLLSRGNW